MGFRVEGLGFGIKSVGFRVQSLGFRAQEQLDSYSKDNIPDDFPCFALVLYWVEAVPNMFQITDIPGACHARTRLDLCMVYVLPYWETLRSKRQPGSFICTISPQPLNLDPKL